MGVWEAAAPSLDSAHSTLITHLPRYTQVLLRAAVVRGGDEERWPGRHEPASEEEEEDVGPSCCPRGAHSVPKSKMAASSSSLLLRAPAPSSVAAVASVGGSRRLQPLPGRHGRSFRAAAADAPVSAKRPFKVALLFE